LAKRESGNALLGGLSGFVVFFAPTAASGEEIPMSETVADVLLGRLREWDVSQVFGYPGDGINGLLAAWGRADNKPQFVQARHEEMAAFEAVGYAKFSGKVGVCVATSGPGAIHLLNGLYDAKLDHVPVVAIVGQTERSAMGGSYQQEVDLLSLYKDVCSDYVQMCTVPQQLPNLIDRAIRIAQAEHAPTCIIIPSDVFDLPYEPPGHAFKQVPSSVGTARASVTPSPQAVWQAAEILNAGHKVALLVGQGARDCVPELTEIADLLGAGAAKALLGKDVLPDDLPWVTGSIGLLGTIASYKMMMGCDTLLTIGSNFPYTQFLPELDQARAIQIDRSGKWIGMRYPYELNMVGDAKATLQALIPHLERKQDRSWREGIEADVADWWDTMQRQAMTDADPINPMRIFHELSSRLPADAIVAADSGSAANWYARHLKFGANMRGSLSGTLATMGPGVPYVIGAKWAHPNRPAIALVGDGAMQMNGLAELITIAHYWRQWSDPRLIIAILHNNDLNQVTWEMRAMEGSPKFAESQTLPEVDYAAFARSLSLGGVNVDTASAVGPAWEQALSSDRPTVLDVRCDPNVPPIPPHATFEQVKSLAGAVLHGDEDTWGFAKQGIKQKLQQYMPGRKDGD
jgi:pyruvate dehydrogenase (quinone)